MTDRGSSDRAGGEGRGAGNPIEPIDALLREGRALGDVCLCGHSRDLHDLHHKIIPRSVYRRALYPTQCGGTPHDPCDCKAFEPGSCSGDLDMLRGAVETLALDLAVAAETANPASLLRRSSELLHAVTMLVRTLRSRTEPAR